MLNNRFSFISLLILLVALTVAIGCSAQREVTDTPRPCRAFHLGTKGYLCEIPSNLIKTVGDTMTTNVDGSMINLTLVDFKETELERSGSHKNRYFETKFQVHNEGDRSVVLLPETTFSAANDSGYRYSRGGKVHLATDVSVTIEPSSEALVILKWETTAYNTTDGKTAAQTIWITVNTPISEDIDVPLEVGSVFRISFAETD